EFSSADSIHFDESLKTSTLNKRRTVYGGGGIMPDCFVPVDTTSYSTYYRNLVAKGVLNKFAVTYVDENREALKKRYKDVDGFVSGFVVDDEFLRRVVELGQQEGVEYVDEDYVKSRDVISTIVKGLIARDVYDTSAYFRIANPLDPIFQKALEIISDGASYDAILQ
ncbi:MAG: peptidase S41, partial [Muribaculaceae bacterium]